MDAGDATREQRSLPVSHVPQPTRSPPHLYRQRLGRASILQGGASFSAASVGQRGALSRQGCSLWLALTSQLSSAPSTHPRRTCTGVGSCPRHHCASSAADAALRPKSCCSCVWLYRCRSVAASTPSAVQHQGDWGEGSIRAQPKRCTAAESQHQRLAQQQPWQHWLSLCANTSAALPPYPGSRWAGVCRHGVGDGRWLAVLQTELWQQPRVRSRRSSMA